MLSSSALRSLFKSIKDYALISILCSSIWIGFHILYEYNHFMKQCTLHFPHSHQNKHIKTKTTPKWKKQQQQKNLQVLLTK